MHFRTVFLSDIHLGSRGAQVEPLLDFLDNNTFETAYLVGDIVDGWALGRKVYFPTRHMTVLRRFVKMAAKGVKVYYTPGNHDEFARDFLPLKLDNIEVADEFVHESADGKRYLVVHGDRWDQVTRYAHWVAFLGDIGYATLLRSNRYVNAIRRQFGYGYWSLSAYVKQRVKSAVNFIGEYEDAVVKAVRDRGLDGVVCGHIHHAEVRDMDGIAYMNDGDWVETCSALVEHEDGRFELIYWRPEEA